MSKKRTWNIWRIKNRWLRSIVVALVGTPLIVAAVAFVAFIAVIAGMAEGAAYAWSVFWREQDIKKISSNWWRAVTLRDAT